MADLNLPYGIKVLNPKPVDAKYLNGSVPYISVAEANSLISEGIRHTGLTVNVLGVEYWYKDGVTDPDLIIKTVDSTVSGVNVGSGAEVFSGATGSTSYFRRISGSGDTTVIESGDTIVVHSSGGTGGGADEYTGATPSDIVVGHLQSGSVLTGRSYTSIFQEMLVQSNPTLTNPNNSFNFKPSQTSPQEVGTNASVDTCATFNQGSIDPVYSPGVTDKRSGLPNQYNYTGDGLPASVASSSLTDDRPSFSHAICLGTNQWTSSVAYDAGTQPYDVNGDPYDSPYPAGTTGSKSLSITGIYPWFYGSTVSAPVANQSLIDNGTKVMATSSGNISTGTMSFTSEYLWFAIPETSTSKTIWAGSNSVSNTGNIGGVSNLLTDETVVSIDSPNAYWSGVNYKIYLGNYPTDANYYFTFKNS